MIIIDDAVQVEDLRVVEARLLIIVHRVEVVGVLLALRKRNDAVAGLSRHRLRVERVGAR